MGLTLNYGAFVLERCLQLNGELEALSPTESWNHCYLKLQEEALHRDPPGLRATCHQSTSAPLCSCRETEIWHSAPARAGSPTQLWDSRDGDVLISKVSGYLHGIFSLVDSRVLPLFLLREHPS